MLHENNFHDLIEKQNSENKEAAWKKLSERLPERTRDLESELNNGSTVKIAKRKAFVISVVAGFIALIAALAVILAYNFNSQDPLGRYCESQDYTTEPFGQTLKEYSAENNKNWLCFDWYEDTEYFDDYVFKLKSTGEVICFSESIFDNETGDMISINITDNRTEIDTLDSFKTCDDKQSFNGTDIRWLGNDYASLATFEFNGYVYYLKIDSPSEANAALEYAKLLLSK